MNCCRRCHSLTLPPTLVILGIEGASKELGRREESGEEEKEMRRCEWREVERRADERRGEGVVDRFENDQARSSRPGMQLDVVLTPTKQGVPDPASRAMPAIGGAALTTDWQVVIL